MGPIKIELIAKDLLDSKGEVSRGQGNMPGDWFAGFMKRNKMSVRYSSNIKRSRSKVDAEDITSFFNYDETNFTNNPGKTPVLVRRGRIRVENCQEVSKQSLSVMWCGSASGELLPSMVVYKGNEYELLQRLGSRRTKKCNL